MRRVFLAAAVLAAAADPPVAAQETTGELVAVVSSQDGQPLPGAALELEDPERALSLAATAGDDGRCVFPALPVGSYRLSASLEGFSTVTTAVKVALGATSTVRLELPLGPVSETVRLRAMARGGSGPPMLAERESGP